MGLFLGWAFTYTIAGFVYVNAALLFFPRQADGEDAVFVYPLVDFAKARFFYQLIHFLLAAAAHYPSPGCRFDGW